MGNKQRQSTISFTLQVDRAELEDLRQLKKDHMDENQGMYKSFSNARSMLAMLQKRRRDGRLSKHVMVDSVERKK